MALAGGWVSLPEVASLGQDLSSWRICCWRCRERLSARVGRRAGKGKIKGAWEPDQAQASSSERKPVGAERT